MKSRPGESDQSEGGEVDSMAERRAAHDREVVERRRESSDAARRTQEAASERISARNAGSEKAA